MTLKNTATVLAILFLVAAFRIANPHLHYVRPLVAPIVVGTPEEFDDANASPTPSPSRGHFELLWGDQKAP